MTAPAGRAAPGVRGGMFRPGQEVYFGRLNGEQTRGEVVKVNASSIKVRQIEERGTQRVRGAGTVWRVHPSLVRHADPSAVPAKPRRPETEILREIADSYCRLSPENLTGDGELPVSLVRRRRSQLNARLVSLFKEIGRRVSEEEASAVTKDCR